MAPIIERPLRIPSSPHGPFKGFGRDVLTGRVSGGPVKERTEAWWSGPSLHRTHMVAAGAAGGIQMGLPASTESRDRSFLTGSVVEELWENAAGGVALDIRRGLLGT